MEKVARWSKRPLRIIMCDIPLNLTTAFAYISAGFPGTRKTLVNNVTTLREILKENREETEFIFIPSLFVEELRNVKIHLLHNHESLSEMDPDAIEFYLKTLVKEDTDYFLEINSHRIDDSSYTGGKEVSANYFPIPKSHALISRTPTWDTPKGKRYLQSLYINKNLVNTRKEN